MFQYKKQSWEQFKPHFLKVSVYVVLWSSKIQMLSPFYQVTDHL